MSDSVKTMVELGKFFNVSQPRVSQWKKAGMPIESDGSYSKRKITAWRALWATEKVEAMLPTSAENEDLQSVNEVMDGLGRFRKMVDEFKRNRGDIFAGVEAKLVSITEEILNTVTKKEILAMPLKERLRFLKDFVSSITTLYNSERIEKGMSTENISVYLEAVHEIRKERDEKEKKDFIEWIQNCRDEKIPIPNHGIESIQEKGKRWNVNVEGLIFMPIEEIREKNLWKNEK